MIHASANPLNGASKLGFACNENKVAIFVRTCVPVGKKGLSSPTNITYVAQGHQVEGRVQDGHAEQSGPAHRAGRQQQPGVLLGRSRLVVLAADVAAFHHEPALADGELGQGRNAGRQKAKQHADLPRPGRLEDVFVAEHLHDGGWAVVVVVCCKT